MDTIVFYPVTLTLEIDLLFKNLNLANICWTVSARALIFHMSIPSDKAFQWVPLFFTMWPWPSCLTHFLKTLTLLLTFEQWVLELWYFTWEFLVMRPFSGYHIFYPVTLTLEFDLLFKNFKLANNFSIVSARASIFHMSIPCDKTFLLVPLFFTLWPWPESMTYF